jgi:hypothetical protein
VTNFGAGQAMSFTLSMMAARLLLGTLECIAAGDVRVDRARGNGSAIAADLG